MSRKRSTKDETPPPKPPGPRKLEFTPEDAEMLDRIARGELIQGAQTILRALKLKMEHTVAKPRQDIAVDGGLTVSIKQINKDELGGNAPTLPEIDE